MNSILIVSNGAFVYQSVNPLDLAEVLAGRGHQVTVAAPFTGESAAWNEGRGFALERLQVEGGRGRNRRFLLGALQAARRLRPDVVVGVDAVGLVTADVIRSLRVARRAVWYALELNLPEEHRHSLAVRWQVWRARRMDLVVTTGPERAAVMASRFALPLAPLVVANAPLRATGRHPGPLASQAMASGVKAGAYLVYAGSNGEGNRLITAAEASRMWRSDVGLVLAAFGGTAGERDALGNAVDASPGRAALAPPIPGNREALVRWLSGADMGLVLFDHRTDGTRNMELYTPNKLFDYLAAGLAVVASDNPGLRSVVEGWSLGVCVDPRDPRLVAAAVDQVVGRLADFQASGVRAFSTHFRYELQAAEACDRIAAL